MSLLWKVESAAACDQARWDVVLLCLATIAECVVVEGAGPEINVRCG